MINQNKFLLLNVCCSKPSALPITNSYLLVKKHSQVVTMFESICFGSDSIITIHSNLSLSKFLGRGGGLVVSVLVFYSNDPSLNPAGH